VDFVDKKSAEFLLSFCLGRKEKLQGLQMLLSKISAWHRCSWSF